MHTLPAVPSSGCRPNDEAAQVERHWARRRDHQRACARDRGQRGAVLDASAEQRAKSLGRCSGPQPCAYSAQVDRDGRGGVPCSGADGCWRCPALDALRSVRAETLVKQVGSPVKLVLQVPQ